MKKSYFFSTLLFALLLFGFIDNGFYFQITKQDILFKKPKGFPKPIYDLEKNKPTPEGFMLGRKLFYDPLLSKDNTISCATCHQQFAAFAQTDHSFSHGVNGLFGKRNTPALQNLIWKDAFMLDGGVNHLDLQPISPITNPLEMNESLSSVLKKLQQNKEYVGLFKAIYKDSIITSDKFLKSLSQFLALLISADSRYDRFINGKDTLSKSEKNGLKLFRANCASCHKEPLFTDNSYRNNGLTMSPTLQDSGRFLITRLQTELLQFKVPSLRNIEVTYPYMHDGRFYSLKQVLNHYTKISSSKEILDPVLKKEIKFNDQEKIDIVAFLKTLTDKNFLKDRRFMNPNGFVSINKTIAKTSIVNEEDLIKKYKTEWDSVNIVTIAGIPQYANYIDKLDEIPQSISKLTKKPGNTYLKLENLRLELLAGKKHKEAIKDYITFGQPVNKEELISPCTKSIGNLPEVEILENQLIGQSKNGWLVLIKYKTKTKPNIQTNTYTVKYNPIEKNYTILK
jgi:cytochrome c peroxidase